MRTNRYANQPVPLRHACYRAARLLLYSRVSYVEKLVGMQRPDPALRLGIDRRDLDDRLPEPAAQAKGSSAGVRYAPVHPSINTGSQGRTVS
jgi:hypothetical protein